MCTFLPNLRSHATYLLRYSLYNQHARSFSTTALDKVLALPFKLSPQDACYLVDLTAAELKSPVSSFFWGFLNSFTGIRRPLPTPTNGLILRPIYLPIWLSDVALTFKNVLTPPSSDPRTSATDTPPVPISIQTLLTGRDVYLPGHAFSPLTMLILRPDDDFDPTTGFVTLERGISDFKTFSSQTPFSSSASNEEKDIKEQLTVLPFLKHTLPNSLLHTALNSLDSTTLSLSLPKLSIHPSTVRVHFLSSYPLYWPAYLASFTLESEQRTIAIPAHTEVDKVKVRQWDGSKEQWRPNVRWAEWTCSDPVWTLPVPSEESSILKRLERIVLDAFTKWDNEIATGTKVELFSDFHEPTIYSYSQRHPQIDIYLDALMTFWKRKEKTKALEGRIKMGGGKFAIAVGRGGARILTIEEARKVAQEEVTEALEEMREVKPEGVGEEGLDLGKDSLKEDNIEESRKEN